MNQSNVLERLCKQPKHKHRKGTNSVPTSKVSISISQTQYIFQKMKVTHPVLVPNNGSEPRLPADDGAFTVPHHTPMALEGVDNLFSHSLIQCILLIQCTSLIRCIDPILTNLFLTYIPAGGAGCHSLAEEKEERGEFRCPARVCNNYLFYLIGSLRCYSFLALLQ